MKANTLKKPDVPLVRVRSVELYERPVTLRLPFRFGAATVTQCPQAFVRALVQVNGHEVHGATAELMVPKWFDKSPSLTHEQNFEQLREALRAAAKSYVDADEALSPYLLSDLQGQAAIAACMARGLPRLAAQFGTAQLDKAVADATLRALGLGWVDALAAGVLGDPWSPSLPALRPVHAILRHTVGLADRLNDADTEGSHAADGLPDSLSAAIQAYGLTHFKLKLGGQLAADINRLTRIAAVLDAQAGDYRVTLDGNESFSTPEALGDFWRAFKTEPALVQLRERLLLLEQPLPRAITLHTSIAELGIDVPVIVDESDDHPEAFDQAIALGYRGISSKACKGIYRSLRSAALVATQPGLLLSGEDLTCQAGLAVQQDTLLAASLGVTHIERNGHHYVDGFGIAPATEAIRFAQSHPGFYRIDPSTGRARLEVQGGQLDLSSLHGPGFASGAQPDWQQLQRMA